jgi:hypothetical protein
MPSGSELRVAVPPQRHDLMGALVAARLEKYYGALQASIARGDTAIWTKNDSNGSKNTA